MNLTKDHCTFDRFMPVLHLVQCMHACLFDFFPLTTQIPDRECCTLNISSTKGVWYIQTNGQLPRKSYVIGPGRTPRESARTPRLPLPVFFFCSWCTLFWAAASNHVPHHVECRNQIPTLYDDWFTSLAAGHPDLTIRRTWSIGDASD